MTYHFHFLALPRLFLSISSEKLLLYSFKAKIHDIKGFALVDLSLIAKLFISDTELGPKIMSNFTSRALFFGAALVALASPLTYAAGDTHKSSEPAPTQFEYRGDADNGKKLSTTCAACHGGDGNSMISAFPKLAGQHASYIYKQLQDMRKPKDGEAARPVMEMSAIVSSLSDQDMADLASYFETQKSTVVGVNPDLISLGETIYRSGNIDTNVPACTSCHQPDGAGVGLAKYPSLAGQFPEYTTKQLKAFRAAGREDLDATYRTNDGASMVMRLSAKGLSDKEIQAVSAYVGALMSKAEKESMTEAE